GRRGDVRTQDFEVLLRKPTEARSCEGISNGHGQAKRFLACRRPSTPDSNRRRQPLQLSPFVKGTGQQRQNVAAKGDEGMAVAEKGSFVSRNRSNDLLMQRRAATAAQFLGKLFKAATSRVAGNRFEPMLDQIGFFFGDRQATEA